MTQGPLESPGIAIAVLTFRRPGDLVEILPALRRQAATVSPPAQIVVVDNDPAGSAERVVRASGGPGVRYLHEPTPGIAAARNRALDACDRPLLVFIDDDERPSATWLRSLVETYLAERSTGVVGPVISEPEHEPDRWIVAGRFFDRLRHPTATVVPVAATNNLLLDLAQVRDLGLRFDERFGLSGGSDTLFSRQLARRGGRLVWCDEAVVTDVVPASRLTREWVLRRAYRMGNSDARTLLEVADAPSERLAARVRMTGRGLLRVAGGALKWVIGLVTGSLRQRARGLRTLMRGAGMLAGSFGGVYSEYARG